MPMDKSGKYHMNPHHAKAADASAKQGAEGSPKEEASEPMPEAMAEGDTGSGMEVQCPGCGERFPLEQGLAPQQMPGQGAVTTQSSGAPPMALSGY